MPHTVQDRDGLVLFQSCWMLGVRSGKNQQLCTFCLASAKLASFFKLSFALCTAILSKRKYRKIVVKNETCWYLPPKSEDIFRNRKNFSFNFTIVSMLEGIRDVAQPLALPRGGDHHQQQQQQLWLWRAGGGLHRQAQGHLSGFAPKGV